MPAASRSLALLLTCSFVGCLPPPLKDCSDIGCTEPPVDSSGEATEASVPTTAMGSTTETGDASSTSSGDTGATTGVDAGLPAIVGVAVEPSPILQNGWIAIGAEAELADGVRMLRDDGVMTELELVERGKFSGQIPAFTGLDNGRHSAELTPWRLGLEGLAVDAPYTIALPVPGSQGPWKTGASVGPGSVVALGVLPDRRVVEFGTFDAGGEPRCYLRRREHDDASWQPEDLVMVLAGGYCDAVDMQIDRTLGTLHLLAERKGGDGVQWWLGEIASWGKGAKQVELGAVGDNVQALALAEDGTVAVCGWLPAPLPATDRDAAVWLVRPGQPKKLRTFDYKPIGKNKAHLFGESTRDCVFAKDQVLVVGEASGPHDLDAVVRDRGFLLEHDPGEGSADWTVFGTGPGSDTQSRVFAVDVDEKGRYLLAGLSCGDECNPAGEYRVYAPGGKLEWEGPLGPLGSDLAGPHDIAWSPAGYLVIATAASDGDVIRFEVRAYVPGDFEPLWTYMPDNIDDLQVALTLAVGDFGEVYAGGLGEGKFPAVAWVPG